MIAFSQVANLLWMILVSAYGCVEYVDGALISVRLIFNVKIVWQEVVVPGGSAKVIDIYQKVIELSKNNCELAEKCLLC